jgi:hypothetical protein
VKCRVRCPCALSLLKPTKCMHPINSSDKPRKLLHTPTHSSSHACAQFTSVDSCMCPDDSSTCPINSSTAISLQSHAYVLILPFVIRSCHVSQSETATCHPQELPRSQSRATKCHLCMNATCVTSAWMPRGTLQGILLKIEFTCMSTKLGSLNSVFYKKSKL